LSGNNDETGQEKLETVVKQETEYKTEVKEDLPENIKELKSQLEQEQEKVASYEKKIQYLLADFENLKKRIELDVQNRVNEITDNIILKFLSIYDDFVRAREALSKQKAGIGGLDGILKNMNSFLSEFGVKPIEALGEIFDPKFHEAISIREAPELDDNTITGELRKGYILTDRVIRPSLVEISKKRDIRETNRDD
jgi:molecular chaperone GrpE